MAAHVLSARLGRCSATFAPSSSLRQPETVASYIKDPIQIVVAEIDAGEALATNVVRGWRLELHGHLHGVLAPNLVLVGRGCVHVWSGAVTCIHALKVESKLGLCSCVYNATWKPQVLNSYCLKRSPKQGCACALHMHRPL